VSTPITYRKRLMDRYALLYDWLPDSGPVLDVGCGNGIYTSWLAKKCAPTFGVDHNLKNLAWAKNEFPHAHFLMGNGEGLPFPAEYFNAVMLTEVLEHTHDDRKTLEEIHRVTRPGGVLLLSVPHKGLFGFLDPDNLTNRAFDSVRKLKIPKPGGGRFYQNFRYDTHRHYTASQLLALLGKSWEVEETFYGGLLLYPLLYGVENAIDAFSSQRSYWKDLRTLRSLRAFDFNLCFGKLSYNIALRCRRI
jgi:ubiquinone/menaquinone biosynthesis C-methylase UbiE